jgi:hypothetical protein
VFNTEGHAHSECSALCVTAWQLPPRQHSLRQQPEKHSSAEVATRCAPLHQAAALYYSHAPWFVEQVPAHDGGVISIGHTREAVDAVRERVDVVAIELGRSGTPVQRGGGACGSMRVSC